MTLRPRWRAAAELVAEHRDVLDARPHDGQPPDALARRGWPAFLLALDDEQLARLEVEGVDAAWFEHAPPSLVELSRRAREVGAVAPLSLPSGSTRPPRLHETPRKGAQIDAFARFLLPLVAKGTRVVDVGSGHGHLTREIAERIALPVVGLERDVALADRARALSLESGASFAITDVVREGLSLSRGDCVIGLHACGDLGDAIVESAARSRASVALVGCCLQKRRALSRRPLCAAAERVEIAEALDLPRDILGLSNLTARDEGVEATRADNLAARERRLALHRLLSADGAVLRIGAEIEGLNRRAAQRDLGSLVARAFRLRGRQPPQAAAIEEAAAWARVHHARARRLSIPRALLARVLEVFVLLDRALFLEEHGFTVTIGTLFPAEISARNVAVRGSAPDTPDPLG